MNSDPSFHPTSSTGPSPTRGVDPAPSPGSVPDSERLPRTGERIHTHAGTGAVVRILDTTADGGRVFEVSIDDGREPPLFAATAGVRVRPLVPEEPLAGDGGAGSR